MIGVGCRRSRGRDVGHARVSSLRRVGVEQTPARPRFLTVEVRMKREAQEAPLVEGVGTADAQRHEPGAQVVVQRAMVIAQPDHPQLADLIDDEDVAGESRCGDDLERRCERRSNRRARHRVVRPLGHELDPDLGAEARDRSEPGVVVGIPRRVRDRGRGRGNDARNEQQRRQRCSDSHVHHHAPGAEVHFEEVTSSRRNGVGGARHRRATAANHGWCIGR